MDIYIVIWEDRHCESTAHPFSDSDAAIAWAKEQVNEFAYDLEDIDEELNQAMIDGGWIYNCVYSCESDSIRVIKTQLNGDLL